MLGLASFVNHDCKPNARFIVDGEKSASTVAIQSIKTIEAGDEITVSYGESYFGDDNKNCRCVGCQQASSLDLTAPLFETISEVSTARTISQPKNNNCERDDVVPSAEVSSEVSSVNISAPPPDFVCEPAVVGSVEFEVDNIDEQDEVVVSAEVSSEVPSVNISAPPPDIVCEPAVVGSAEFEVDNFCERDDVVVSAEEMEVDQQVRRVKTVKTDEVVERLICHVTVKRIDRHLKQHRDTICKREERFLIDLYRTRNAPKSKKVYDCLNCYRRFVSIVTHQYKAKCDCTNVVRVENCASRR